MDIQNEYEQELVFQIESDDKKEKQTKKQKRVVKLAAENLKKMVIDKLSGRTGEC